jgi:hypothetical protein
VLSEIDGVGSAADASRNICLAAEARDAAALVARQFPFASIDRERLPHGYGYLMLPGCLDQAAVDGTA